MAAGTKMKIKKGDTVQMLAGKDRGKQGRVVQARPRDGKVIVENLNVAKRSAEAEAAPRHEPHGRPVDDPGRHHRQAGGRRRSATSCSSARPASCRRASASTTKEVKGETIKVRVCKRDGCGQEIDR